MKHLGDITLIDGHRVPITDVVVGGSPCQDLSVAGKRAGLKHSDKGDDETTRSGLFMEQIRLVKEMRESDRQRSDRRADVDIRPRYMVWENVPGAFSSNKGDDFRVVLEEVARVSEAGIIVPGPPKGKWSTSGIIIGDSFSIAYRVFDAQHWGVPQRRKRICLVADFNGHTAPSIVFDETEHNGCTNNSKTEPSIGDIGDASRSEIQSFSEGLSGNTEQSRETWEETSTDAERSLGASHPAYTYQDREGKPGGGKGGLIQEDRATSLRTNNYMTVFQPTFAIEGNGQRPSHKGDGYTESDKSYTLNTTEVHGVAYGVTTKGNGEPTVCYKGNGDEYGETSGCLTGHPQNADQGQGWEETDKSDTLNVFDNSENRTPTVVVSMDRAAFNQGQNAKYDFAIETDGITHTLVAKGPGAVAYGWYPQMKAEGIAWTEDKATTLVNGTNPGWQNGVAYAMQGFGDYKECEALSSCKQRDWKDSTDLVVERYPDMPNVTGSLMASGYDKLGTQEAANGMYIVENTMAVDLTNMTESDTNGALQASAEHNIRSNNVVRVRYIVRRLTPLECERLQGFPDGWTDIGEWVDTQGKVHKPADSNRYKALGNSIALPSWYWVLERMSRQYKTYVPTMASLFDGIAGFPLCWESINGKGTYLWASEIEEFPMAVTRKRFE